MIRPFRTFFNSIKKEEEVQYKYPPPEIEALRAMKTKIDIDDIEEIVDDTYDANTNSESEWKNGEWLNPTPAPAPPTTGDLCKKWFLELCENTSIKKYYYSNYNSNMFGVGDERFDYPYLRTYNNRYTICYKDYNLEITAEEGERLWAIFNASIDMYYNNLFKSKLEDIEKMKHRKQKNVMPAFKRGTSTGPR